jgi:DNA-directed RNA polymerase II subunit RPB2
MLRSQFCSLAEQPDAALAELGEDPYDQGGYFVINGSEKVLIAQERMAANHVYVFRKSQPSKYAYVAECRSVVEGSTRGGSGVSVKLLAPKSAKARGGAGGGGGSGSVLRASIPYIKADIPILILFRALGCVVRFSLV